MINVISEDLCIAIGKVGGIAAVIQFRSIEDAAELIKKVKKQKHVVAGTSGVTKDFKERTAAIIKAGANFIIYDTLPGQPILA